MVKYSWKLVNTILKPKLKNYVNDAYKKITIEKLSKLIDRYKLVLHSKIKQKVKLEEYRNVETNYKNRTNDHN